VELIQSEQPNVAVEPQPEPRYHTASLPVEKTEHGQTWLRTLAVILVGLVLVVLIVLLARWIYHRSHHAVAPQPSTTSLQSPANSSAKKASGAQPSNNAGSAAPSSGSSSATTTPQPTTTGTNSQITNTGPGDVAAIFVATSLAAAGLHYILSLRRQTHSSTKY
jgi:cytoskeletal protein RodZ